MHAAEETWLAMLSTSLLPPRQSIVPSLSHCYETHPTDHQILAPAENKAEHGLDRSQFKWWFNYMSWGPGQLEDQVLKGSWDVMEGEGGEGEGVARAVLRQGLALDRELWRTLRRHYLPRERGYDADGEEE